MPNNAEKETKEQRLKRVASARTQKVLETLRLLGNCGNRSVYEYTEGDVKKIFNTIESEVKRVKALFVSRENSFKL